MSSDCEVVYKELQNYSAIHDNHLESCQTALSQDQNALKTLTSDVDSIKKEIKRVLSWLSRLETTIANDQNSSKIDKLEKLVQGLLDCELHTEKKLLSCAQWLVIVQSPKMRLNI